VAERWAWRVSGQLGGTGASVLETSRQCAGGMHLAWRALDGEADSDQANSSNLAWAQRVLHAGFAAEDDIPKSRSPIDRLDAAGGLQTTKQVSVEGEW
jgi:hypothetical protein